MPYNAQGQWIGGSGGGLLGPEDAVKMGLGGAGGLIGSPQAVNYPAYVPSQTQGPSQGNFINYTPNQPMAQIQAPNYQLNSTKPNWQSFTPTKLGATPSYEGLMGGDYNALQTALQTPGAIAARQAYDQGQTNLTNTMGGRGLYGSSIMSNQARNALEQPYMDALATNAAQAAAQRYQQQAADLQNKNTFGMKVYGQQMGQNTAQQGLMATQNTAQNTQATDLYKAQLAQEQNRNTYAMDAAKLGMTQNQNVYNASVADAARQQDYSKEALTYQNQGNEAQRAWQNAQDLEKFQYQLATGTYGNQQNTQAINQYLALAGLGAPLAAANQTNATNSQAGWLGLAGAGLGLLGNYISS